MLLAGVAVGAISMVAVSQTGLIGFKAKAAGPETYRQLDIFGDIFERVRSQYVSKPEDRKSVV